MTVKESLIRRIEQMDEQQLEHLEKQLRQEDQKRRELELRLDHERREADRARKIERQLAALRAVAGMISDPDDVAAFAEATRRRPLFGGRTLDLEPDDAT